MSLVRTAASLGRDRVCFECVHDAYLKAKIETRGTIAGCDYCRKTNHTISLDELVNEVSGIFADHYERTPEGPTREEQRAYDARDEEWQRSGETSYDVLRTHVTENADLIKSVVWALGDIPLVDDEGPTEWGDPILPSDRWVRILTNTSEWWDEWNRLEESIWTGSRFFNDRVHDLLSRLFVNLSEFSSGEGQPVIREWRPGEEELPIYRARIFDDEHAVTEALKNPVSQLSAPPSEIVRGGRMNPLGASLLYAATDPETAISEVRPYVGAMVVVAQFHLTRPIRLLDFNALRSADREGSLLDPENGKQLSRGDFLSELVMRLTRPLSPRAQDREYLISQIVSDFLQHQMTPSLDGIIYPSAQVPDGMNVILFRNSLDVEELHNSGRSIVEVEHTASSEGGLPSYKVVEHNAEPVVDDEYEWDSRTPPSLRIEVGMLRVYRVDEARYTTTTIPVKLEVN